MFQTPKQLSVINGEPLVKRTIRLLKENGIEYINISSNDKRFDNLGVPRIEHENTFKVIAGKIYGYWVDAYYPTNEPTIYLHGDVYYTENAIKKIINYKATQNTFIGNELPITSGKNWGEPFGWIIINTKQFREAINNTKRLQDENKLDRGYAISWELYRVHEGLDPNIMQVNKNSYLVIKDLTDDIDSPEKIKILENRVKGVGAIGK
jgi:hypothetical protein